MARALFLDRDGVINKEKEGSYIFTPDEFIFYDGVCRAIAQLSVLFDYIIVVTNQRGIGRGLMTERALERIHQKLKTVIVTAGGRIDAIYYAPHLEDHHPRRKPNTGMAEEAKKDFPDIDFDKSIMVGNSLSDMAFGRQMNMTTVFLHTTQPPLKLPHSLVDFQYGSLGEWMENGALK